jgi:hypothetical protein
MLKIQVSTPEMKALAESVRSMAVDPMTALQTLAGDIRGRFEDWTNELMQAELSLYLGREPYERSAKSPKNHGNGYRSRRDFAAVEFGDSSHRVDTPGHNSDTRTQNEGKRGGRTLH